jgi:hypothetical protein
MSSFGTDFAHDESGRRRKSIAMSDIEMSGLFPTSHGIGSGNLSDNIWQSHLIRMTELHSYRSKNDPSSF